MTDQQDHHAHSPRHEGAHEDYEKSRDPMRMLNQPALNVSTGRIWLIIGFLFMVASLIPLAALIFVRQGASAPVATGIAIAVIVLYLAMLVIRFAVRPGPVRLRSLAACQITMAVVALGGIMTCAWIERAAALA